MGDGVDACQSLPVSSRDRYRQGCKMVKIHYN
jgi:hypothetical protein